MLRSWHFISTVLKIVFRHPIVGTTIIPVLPNGKIVLVNRRDTRQWSLPGGMVDWGENILSTIKRELKEETGLDLIKINRLVGVYSAPNRDPRVHSISILIEAEVAGNLSVNDTYEICEAKAYNRDALPLGNLAHDHDRQLEDYLQGLTTIA
jgi:8-oxo-dGTP diphosphatase